MQTRSIYAMHNFQTTDGWNSLFKPKEKKWILFLGWKKKNISKAFILVDFFLFPQLLSWLKKIVFPHTCLWHISDKWSPNQYKRHQLFQKTHKVKTHAKVVLREHKEIRAPKRKTSCNCICFRHTWGFSAVTFVRTQCERNVALWHWKIHLFLLFLYKHRFFHHLYGFMKMSKMEYERSQTVTTNP